MSTLVALVGRRLIAILITLAALFTILYFLLNSIGNPISALMGDTGTAAQAEAIREELGLNVPVHERYINYLGDALRGDFGDSWRSDRPVVTMLAERAPATLKLALVALTVAVLFAVPIGVLSAIRARTWVDSASRIVAVLTNSTPNFWLGLMLIVVFAVWLGVLPATGRGSWRHLVLPGLVLSTSSIPILMRVTRSATLEVLNQDYVRTARGKGLLQGQAIRRHALPNAMIPVTTVLSLRVGEMMAGTMIIETVFAYPGVGRVIVEAMINRDYPVVLLGVPLIAGLILAVTLLTDILYTFLDPRVRPS